jgi:hypothetical protein
MYGRPQSARKSRRRRYLTGLGVGLVVGLLTLFATGILGIKHNTLTVREVPWPILQSALTDSGVRRALWKRNNYELHNRLDKLGVEEEIKAFYRPQIQDEALLDQYIHQIFYNVSGYVGVAYRVNGDGVLVPKQNPDQEFQRWFQLAHRAGVVIGSRQEQGQWYVISPGGTIAPYQTVAAVFPEAELQKMIMIQLNPVNPVQP